MQDRSSEIDRDGASGTRAVLWNGNTVTDLPPFSGSISYARGINDAGQVVGGSQIAGSVNQHAVRWDGTNPTDLGTLGGPNSGAFSINNAGQVVGISQTLDGRYRAVIWNGNAPTALGTLGGLGGSGLAWGINDLGHAVGESLTDSTNNGPLRATLWIGSSVVDLNNFLDLNMQATGWMLTTAYDINNSDWITGRMENQLTGESHAFLLSAVPEPHAYTTLLAGLSVLMLIVRRRRFGNIFQADKYAVGSWCQSPPALEAKLNLAFGALL